MRLALARILFNPPLNKEVLGIWNGDFGDKNDFGC